MILFHKIKMYSIIFRKQLLQKNNYQVVVSDCMPISPENYHLLLLKYVC